MLQELEQLVEKKKKNTCDEQRRLRADDICYSKLKYAHLFINTIVNNIHNDGKNNSPLQDANTDKGGRAKAHEYE